MVIILVIFTVRASMLSGSARQAVEDMMGALEDGEIPAGFSESARALADNLLEFGMPQYEVEHIRTFPFMQTTAAVNIREGGDQVRIFLTLVREAGEWRVSKATTSLLRIALDPEPSLVLDFGLQSLTRELQFLGTDKLLTIQSGRMEWLNMGWQEPLPYFTGYVESMEDNLIVGMEDVKLYGYRNNLAAAVARPFNPEIIRVNLSTTGFGSIYHDHVGIRAMEQWEATETVSGRTVSLPPGSVSLQPGEQGIILSSEQEEISFSHRLIFNVRQAGEQLVLTSINRSGRQPAYYGSLEVVNMDGSLIIVNELALENYLRSVVPSEMPVSFGAEALKIQAIAARTYACRNILTSNWRSTSAHVVDSVLSQVYNNTLESNEATAAIEATKGEIIEYEGSPADIRYFSASSGFTGNAHEVWAGNEGDFPGAPIPWLSSLPQFPGNPVDIGEEDDYASFIHNPPAEAYDIRSPWFRWQVSISVSQLESAIEEGLAAVHQASPEAVQRIRDGKLQLMDVLPEEPLGELIDLIPVQRGGGGILMAVDIVGSNGTWRVSREYNIRQVLRPQGTSDNPVELTLHDDSTRSNLTMMPSAYMVWELIHANDSLTEVRFFGGGYGHGVGMSQYGARELTAMGWSKEQIIQHYFPGTEIAKIY